MARRTKLQLAAGLIAQAFQDEPGRVYSRPALTAMLKRHREEWGLPASVGLSGFIQFLADSKQLSVVRLSSDTGEVVTRYVWEQASPLAVALTLRPSAYLSHGTAAWLQGLTDQFAKVIYVNKEQSPKPPPRGGLTQEAIDRAFKGHQRASTYVFHFDIYRAVLLSGKNTGALGVEDVPTPEGEFLPATNVERTLIDLTVRPTYAGGVEEVLGAFRRAREQEKVDVEKLLQTLAQLNYVYPYHQALGFYMERAGFEADALSPLRALGLQHDFYLAYGLKDLVYDAGWRLHHPRGL
ncbi:MULTISPECIES: type IV toxin-antitoxin system AbiEi family antitoxin domain-containing protein [unclassified Corallococcus]|uniref:type IV toxin-antitoxin system AbiEi family antitoxin domain-containing protein n=1 Tax=unclassified Corallococcus TaxID=2685029 RepID=UPI001A8E01EE|nr:MULTISPECIES: hypothetical protein [unclassified Corallococcus]MBN9682167.1 hypothetical protein [Corallococcus sp. NCSPR001]WAS86271.1 hypothetical protein O0N60_04695 [Corallococcus sp. NCRR]